MRRGLIGIVIAATAAMVAATPAGAASQVGETFVPPGMGICVANVTLLQSLSPGGQYSAPSGGVITAWSHEAGGAPPAQLKLKVARPVGGDDFTIVGDSPLEAPAPNALNTYPNVRIPVQAGDVIGFFVPAGGACARSTPGYAVHALGSDPSPGATSTYSSEANPQLDVAAVLEPDVDNDGFGDETQDCAPNDASRHDDCSPPETTITKQPKDKTKKKQATFEFSSNEPGSTFECSLDGGGFAPCTSPHDVKVKKGKHSFLVRATDHAGNVDALPASDAWKVKKKRKRR